MSDNHNKNTHISGEMSPDYAKRHTFTDVMTTNVMKEKFNYLCFHFGTSKNTFKNLTNDLQV